MDKRAKLLKKLIKEQGHSIKSFAEKIDMPYTTLYSMLERGVGKATVDNVIRVCKGLGITTDQLQEMSNKRDDNDIHTIAAHHDGEDWTEEELKEIEQFKDFVKAKRKGRDEK